MPARRHAASLVGRRLRGGELTVGRAGRTIAIVTILVAIAAAVAIRLLDHEEFPTIGSGLWWAVQTVTTVGYGDHVPRSTGGRIVGAIVMLTGIGFLSVVTASISAAFVEAARRRVRADEDAARARELHDVAERLARIERLVEGMAAGEEGRPR